MGFLGGIAIVCIVFALGGWATGWLALRLRVLSIASPVFLGSGAYTFALLCRVAPVPVAAAGAILGSGALAVALLSARERVVGTDFALFSFCVQVSWLALVSNWDALTGGALGLPGVPALWGATGLVGGLVTASAVAFAVAALWRRERAAWFSVGAAVLARSSELGHSIGLSPLRTDTQAGLLYGGVNGAAGVLLASYLGYVGPGSFDTSLSVLLVAIGVLSSVGRHGLLLGCAVLVAAPELLRLGGLGTPRAAYLQLLLSGAVVALATVRRPPPVGAPS